MHGAHVACFLLLYQGSKWLSGKSILTSIQVLDLNTSWSQHFFHGFIWCSLSKNIRCSVVTNSRRWDAQWLLCADCSVISYYLQIVICFVIVIILPAASWSGPATSLVVLCNWTLVPQCPATRITTYSVVNQFVVILEMKNSKKM